MTECGISPECGESDFQSGPGTASASFDNPNGGGASAIAFAEMNENGGLILSAYASAVGGTGEGQFVTNSASASAEWSDTVHFSGTLLEIMVDLHFAVTGSKVGDALMSASGIACVNGNCPDPEDVETLDGPGEFNFNPPIYIPHSTPVDISVNLGVHATGHGSAFGLPHSSVADFSHTLSLIAITVRDQFGNIVPGVSISSDSGFDYNPFLVPEPSTCGLCGFALAALALPRSGRRRG